MEFYAVSFRAVCLGPLFGYQSVADSKYAQNYSNREYQNQRECQCKRNPAKCAGWKLYPPVQRFRVRFPYFRECRYKAAVRSPTETISMSSSSIIPNFFKAADIGAPSFTATLKLCILDRIKEFFTDFSASLNVSVVFTPEAEKSRCERRESA